MRHWTRWLIGGFVLLVALAIGTGCAQNERRTTRVVEEEHHGEVVEEDQGEMIVE